VLDNARSKLLTLRRYTAPLPPLLLLLLLRLLLFSVGNYGDCRYTTTPLPVVQQLGAIGDDCNKLRRRMGGVPGRPSPESVMLVSGISSGDVARRSVLTLLFISVAG